MSSCLNDLCAPVCMLRLLVSVFLFSCQYFLPVNSFHRSPPRASHVMATERSTSASPPSFPTSRFGDFRTSRSIYPKSSHPLFSSRCFLSEQRATTSSCPETSGREASVCHRTHRRREDRSDRRPPIDEADRTD